MRFLSIFILFVTFSSAVCAQNKLDKALKKFNQGSVPYIQVHELRALSQPILLDTRKREEYTVSHLKDAIWVGHKAFELDSVVPKLKNKDREIVVYCSIGVRSENIGEKLQEAGYKVKNLYGGIFEWKNEGYPVYDSEGKATENIHAFNKHWGKLLKNGQKVYDSVNNE